jgi:hypothetical protein
LRHKDTYEREGLRRTVEGILLVNEHNHPHVLLLQSGGGAGGAAVTFKLPGGRLRHGRGWHFSPWHFPPRYFAVKIPVDDSRHAPCKTTLTPGRGNASTAEGQHTR